jgi:hypothetical protein
MAKICLRHSAVCDCGRLVTRLPCTRKRTASLRRRAIPCRSGAFIGKIYAPCLVETLPAVASWRHPVLYLPGPVHRICRLFRSEADLLPPIFRCRPGRRHFDALFPNGCQGVASRCSSRGWHWKEHAWFVLRSGGLSKHRAYVELHLSATSLYVGRLRLFSPRPTPYKDLRRKAGGTGRTPNLRCCSTTRRLLQSSLPPAGV